MQNTISIEFVIAVTALYPYFTIKVNVEGTFATLQFIEIASKTFNRLSESDQRYLYHLHVKDSILFVVFLCHH